MAAILPSFCSKYSSIEMGFVQKIPMQKDFFFAVIGKQLDTHDTDAVQQ